MNLAFVNILGRRMPSAPWSDTAPVREELFGVERLEQHAQSLAAAQTVSLTPPPVLALHVRLSDNARVLLAAYRASASELDHGHDVVPAAEWLLDNYHLVEKQVREVRDDMPPGYYRQLPKLASGPLAGYPRVFGLAWAFVAHTDSHFDPATLRRFIDAYQRVQPLTIGELWAVAITLRIVLIENLRRLADQIAVGRSARLDANRLADRLLAPGRARAALDADIASRPVGPLSELFAAQLAQRLRDQDPLTMPALGWLEERLIVQGTSVEQVVRHAQQRQGASNVTVRNIITSMRLMSDIDWADLFESVSLVDARLAAGSGYAGMDFATRNLYRSAIEQLARGAKVTELEVAAHALAAANRGAPSTPSASVPGPVNPLAGEPGYYLIAEGRLLLEKTIGFKAPARLRIDRLHLRLGLGGYVGGIVAVSLFLLALALQTPLQTAAGVSTGALVLWLVAMWLPATEMAAMLVNRWVAWRVGTARLPALDVRHGVPPALRTLVAIPTLLVNEADLHEQIERLEVHHLASGGGDIVFALLADGLDADQAVLPGDAALLAAAVAGIAALNQRHGPAPCGDRFLLLHRRRLFNQAENTWMGWERKRGKLHELNRLLRGATDTSFEQGPGDQRVPHGVVYVITLDADTQLPRDAALRLIGKMAHPLNRPRFDAAHQRVVGGYGILQPRVTPALPVGREGSLYQRVSSGPGGMDPYAAAVSDVYQDLFGEGSYTGKGIYDVDAFEAALAGRVPDNTLLSHDLFEGVFARAGLASDVELVEEAPSRYDVAGRRQHRWTRGDWQLLPWIFSRRSGPHALPAVGRWKMLDNLRRSLVAPSALLALAASWLLPAQAAQAAVLLVLATFVIPAALPPLLALWPRRAGVLWSSHGRALVADLKLGALQALFALVFLADQSWRMADAVTRTLVRLLFTRRRLLEWTTAAQTARRPRPDIAAAYRQMAGGLLLAAALTGGAMWLSATPWPDSLWLALPFAALWLASPVLAWSASRPPRLTVAQTLQPADAQALRLIARRTWRFFETFVTPADHMLPPDNFQEDPKPVVARRTSPTNIGLYLLSAVSARDFGWAGTLETATRLEATFATLRELPRFNGHFFNWYGTADLRALEPPYVSSVDSGNLAGHLIALANACEEWRTNAAAPNARAGLQDNLALALEAIGALPAARGESGARVADLLQEMAQQLRGPLALDTLAPALVRLADKAAAAATALLPAGEDGAADLVFWIESIGRAATSHGRDRQDPDAAPAVLGPRLQALADTAREMALAMDFAFLLDTERKLLSIGYAPAEQRLDSNCYDLLASEARLASLFAIAKGDVSTRHWFRLGRSATPVGKGSALISWSGSMFEYLMPALVMRAPVGSLLEQTNRLAVERQAAYGNSLGIPWGVSESAYNARDLEFTYQYSNFGVPGLGLKRGLAENVVIAPYATGLATMVDAYRARLNYMRLALLGAMGRYGFYEALDFTPSRLPEDAAVAVVRSYMAHHQGMTIVAIGNALQDGLMRTRFHREPMIQSAELLLQERVPRNVAVAHPRAEEVRVAPHDSSAGPAAVRRIPTSTLDGPPVTHLMSNGRYAVMITAGGGGYSRWRNVAVTRWKEDATRDGSGALVYLRDVQTGNTWSASGRPMPGHAPHCEVVFGEDHATFTRRGGYLSTTMDVLVSGEADGEVRRLSLANTGRRPREIELTSYAELVLAPQSSDDAHPAFSKLFVITEYLPEFGALLATRRPRGADEAPVWAAHFAVVEGELSAEPQYESDRARFLGRGRDVANAAAIADGAPLSNTTGTVLDAVFSLRRRVLIAPGGLARISFWTLVAHSRAALLDLIDQHHDRSAFERAKTLAWTQAQVQLRHLGADAEEAADFQRLAAPLLYADRRFRAGPEALLRGAGPQSGLWAYSVSGDLPIVVLRIDEAEDLAQVRQLLRAHEYWRMKQLAVDLVIVNERASSYMQDLQVAIETAVRSSQSRPGPTAELAKGAVHALRADLLDTRARALLNASARVVLSAGRGPLRSQLDRLLPLPAFPNRAALQQMATTAAPAAGSPSPSPAPADASASATQAAASAPVHNDLEFFNGLGGFADNGREYVVRLQAGQNTPAPWINVIANPTFGFQASAEGSGYTWSGNSRENQLTPWSNDPVSDPAGEAIYVRDEVSGDVFTATAQPIRDHGVYQARHGAGWSRFNHEAHDIALDLLQYVPMDDAVKISRLTLRNLSGRTRKLSVTGYVEWVLGTSRGASAPFIVTSVNADGTVMATKPWSTAFPGRVAFADLGGKQTAWTADRTEFLGHTGLGGVRAPAALHHGDALSGASGAGLDPCAALQCSVELAANEWAEIVFLVGEAGSAQDAQALVARYRSANLDAVLAAVKAHWTGVLGAVQVRTPDRAMDIMLNGWLLYQTLACRLWARSAFYQASGAYGFRDQLQDGMALAFTQPEATRGHILRAAGRQFPEGDVQHWWLPHSGQGVRTRISDDRVWLAYATASYITSSGDAGILDEAVGFIEGPALRPGEHDAFFPPLPADFSATLFEHCARGLDQCIELTGALGLPLMGTGDWNDGMNRVGGEGRGESVWLAWLLVRTLALFTPYAEQRGDTRAARWRSHAESVRASIEREAWDGAWYRRATFDDGSWLGSAQNDECRIDAIAQSWAVLSGAAEPARAAQAMASLEEHLVREGDAIAPLFTPPFDHTARDPGYIKGYPPGLRENGGQYSHAAMWSVMAFARLGEGGKAAALFALLNPINHARTPEQAARYKVEPYVVAADVYSVAPHAGRGGWTWYTGSAGWMYRAGVEEILGLRREGDTLVVNPCIPADWPGFEITVTVLSTRYAIRVDNTSGRGRGASAVRLPLDGAAHEVVVTL